MNLICEKRNEDWELLALGCLDEEAAEELRAHLRSGCVDCGKAYTEAVGVCTVLGAAGAGDAEPSEAVGQRLAAYAKGSGKLMAWPQQPKQRQTEPQKGWRLSPGWWVAAACACWAVWLGIENGDLKRRVVAVAVPAVAVPAVAVPAVAAPAVAVPAVVPIPEVKDASGDLTLELRQKIALLEERLRQSDADAASKMEDLKTKLSEQGKLAAEARGRLEILGQEKERELLALTQRWQGAERERQAQELRVAELSAELRSGNGKRDSDLAGLQAKLNEGKRELDRQGLLLEDYRTAFRTLEAGGVKQVELAVVDPAGGRGQVRAIFSQQGGLLVLARDLPALPASKCYQLWVLRKGNPSIVSGGLLRLDGAGKGFLAAKPSAALEGATGFALTDEPAGGSVSARGKKLLFGAI